MLLRVMAVGNHNLAEKSGTRADRTAPDAGLLAMLLRWDGFLGVSQSSGTEGTMES